MSIPGLPQFSKSSRNEKLATTHAGLPVAEFIQSAEKVRSGQTLRKGLIGQYRFWVGQIRLHGKQEFLDFGKFVTLSI
jgi:hypothetical protein